ncbi:DUF808 domain-containing protein [Conchiformibius kuhniae]|uniref:DUF808 domain-containing protein n=1 Tax=Conchiformibius kuhniae TaxID=211502 RepID=A0A8T9MVP4_9NEIS|nr:DUF808 domain-containing protein [Conchiformibius kuhniae]UOP04536.1 DUF808 domain-containing protein [Conchiformibius kuhniae]
MAVSSLFTLLDDIASVLDDVALMTKMAAKKTAGVVGDDLALNANQVTGVRAERELPVVWAVAKGSFWNKVILVPLALLLAVFAPVLIHPLLMVGGAYLCFEGVEKLLHKFFPHADGETSAPEAADLDESAKIRGAIRTDFILSAEIIILALGVVQDASLTVKIGALCAIAIGMTVFVYGLVALIVKADDFGAHLLGKPSAAAQSIGRGILRVMPVLMRGLSVAGTLAMFLVGGGIFTHNIPALHDFLHARHWDAGLSGMTADLLAGVAVGSLVCAVVLPVLKRRHTSAQNH